MLRSVHAHDFEHDGWRLNAIKAGHISELKDILEQNGYRLTKENMEHIKRIKEIVSDINKLGKEFWKEMNKFK